MIKQWKHLVDEIIIMRNAPIYKESQHTAHRADRKFVMSIGIFHF